MEQLPERNYQVKIHSVRATMIYTLKETTRKHCGTTLHKVCKGDMLGLSIGMDADITDHLEHPPIRANDAAQNVSATPQKDFLSTTLNEPAVTEQLDLPVEAKSTDYIQHIKNRCAESLR